ncbi:hypothetical protein I547_4675 [Mycobacterium kansasii 824]|nr:hypothetical protein I547_4675 [Mycobacterium kansasii 824]
MPNGTEAPEVVDFAHRFATRPGADERVDVADWVHDECGLIGVRRRCTAQHHADKRRYQRGQRPT